MLRETEVMINNKIVFLKIKIENRFRGMYYYAVHAVHSKVSKRKLLGFYFNLHQILSYKSICMQMIQVIMLVQFYLPIDYLICFIVLLSHFHNRIHRLMNILLKHKRISFFLKENNLSYLIFFLLFF